MRKNLSESILTELDRSNIMSDQNVVDICMSFSSRRNHLKYKIEGNSAVYEDGTIIKFIVNDDSEIEYYFINSQGDASKSAPVYDFSLLDLVTEKPMNEGVVAIENNGQYDVTYGRLYYALSPEGVTIYSKDVYKFISEYKGNDFTSDFDKFEDKYMVAGSSNGEELYNAILKR